MIIGRIASVAGFFMTLSLILLASGCSTANRLYGEPTSAKHIPDGLDLCADYGATVTCTGNRYRMFESDGRFVSRHEGIDFRAPPGTEVLAVTDATVQFIGVDSCGGGFMLLQTETLVADPRSGLQKQLYVTYSHIVPGVASRRKVEAGEVIAKVAGPGQFFGECSDFPHVHLATRVGSSFRKDHVSPHGYWLNGPGIVSCWKPGLQVPRGKLVAPYRC
jgi:murein DD-endopeptidase MepM/ murein hydrolase activator NlpD